MKLLIVFAILVTVLAVGLADKRQSIVDIAKKELGTKAPNKCSKYNPPSLKCADWCAFFATWVWKKAGIDIPQYGMAKDPYIKWGTQKKLAQPGIKGIKPGDLIFYSKGGANNIYHIGLCSKVYPNGNIDTIEGNTGGGGGMVGAKTNRPASAFFGHVKVPGA